eukprot:12852-Heterococcus_DN1.PRE.3
MNLVQMILAALANSAFKCSDSIPPDYENSLLLWHNYIYCSSHWTARGKKEDMDDMIPSRAGYTDSAAH